MEKESEKTEESESGLTVLGVWIIMFGIFVFLEVSSFHIFGNKTEDIYGTHYSGRFDSFVTDYNNIIGQKKYYSNTVESYMYIFSGLLIIGGLGTVVTAMRDEEKKKQDKK